MKKHLPLEEIRKVFSDPLALKKGQRLWKDAEKKGEKFIKEIKNERRKIFERSS